MPRLVASGQSCNPDRHGYDCATQTGLRQRTSPKASCATRATCSTGYGTPLGPGPSGPGSTYNNAVREQQCPAAPRTARAERTTGQDDDRPPASEIGRAGLVVASLASSEWHAAAHTPTHGASCRHRVARSSARAQSSASVEGADGPRVRAGGMDWGHGPCGEGRARLSRRPRCTCASPQISRERRRSPALCRTCRVPRRW